MAKTYGPHNQPFDSSPPEKAAHAQDGLSWLFVEAACWIGFDFNWLRSWAVHSPDDDVVALRMMKVVGWKSGGKDKYGSVAR